MLRRSFAVMRGEAAPTMSVLPLPRRAMAFGAPGRQQYGPLWRMLPSTSLMLRPAWQIDGLWLDRPATLRAILSELRVSDWLATWDWA